MGRQSLTWVVAGVVLVLLGSEATAQDDARAEYLDGLVEPNQVVEVSSQATGILDEVAVDRGDRIEKDQVLVRLKSGLERVAVDLARARLEFAKRRAERNEELYLKELISTHDRDEMETEIRIAELQLREATERLQMRTILSPVRGVVVERSRDPGEYVGEKAILTVARVDPLNVEVIVPVARFGSISRGMEAEVRPEAPVGGVHIARVVIVDRVIDAASGTFGVRLELPNPSYHLPAGLKCKVRFLK